MRSLSVGIAIAMLLPAPVLALDLAWDGGAGTGSWQNAANWNPNQVPSDSDAVTIGDLPAAAGAMVQLEGVSFAQRITLSDAAQIDTNQTRLLIQGNLLVRSDNSRVVVRQFEQGMNTSLDAFNILLQDASTLELAATVDLEDPLVAISTPGVGIGSFGELDIEAAATLLSTGSSVIRFQDGLNGDQATQVNNNGTIRVTQPASPVTNRTYTMLIESTDSGTITDLDGDNGTGTLDLGAFSQLHVKTTTAPFGGVANFVSHSRLRFDEAVTFGDTAVFNFDGGGTNQNRVASDVAINAEGTATFNINSGVVLFSGNTTAASGTQLNVADNAQLAFGFGDSVVSGQINLGSDSTLDVSHGEVTLDDPTFDWDGDENATTTVNNGGHLIINADTIESTLGDDTFNGVIQIVGGATPSDSSSLRTNITQGWRLAGLMEIVGDADGPSGAAEYINGAEQTFTVAASGIVALEGGAIESQTEGIIINEGVVQGHGLIGAEGFFNNGLLRAVAGGNGTALRTTLARNFDLDGSDQVNPGSVEAINGDIEIQGRLVDNFGGVATVGSGRTLDLQVGWILGSPGTLNLVGGAEAATINSTGINEGEPNQQNGISTLRGTVNVTNTGRVLGDAEVRSSTRVNFLGSAAVLEFGGETEVQTGVAFEGIGTLVNRADGEMTLQANLDLGEGTSLANRGQLLLEGDAIAAAFQQTSDGELVLELGGLTEADYQQLFLDGSAALDGDLSLNFVGGFLPSAGDSFTLLTATDFTGAFDINASLLPAGLAFEVDQSGTQYLLSVVNDDDPSGLLGDYNGDGLVNAADYTVWRDTLNSTTDLDADGDGDGVIDQDDYGIWTANYGASQPASSAIPEPGSLLLAGCVLAACGAAGGKRQQRA